MHLQATSWRRYNAGVVVWYVRGVGHSFFWEKTMTRNIEVEATESITYSNKNFT